MININNYIHNMIWKLLNNEIHNIEFVQNHNINENAILTKITMLLIIFASIIYIGLGDHKLCVE